MPDVEKKRGFRIPLVSDLADAAKHSEDLKGAGEAAVGGAEIAALLYALSLPDSPEKMALAGAVMGSSLLILGILREKSRKK